MLSLKSVKKNRTNAWKSVDHFWPFLKEINWIVQSVQDERIRSRLQILVGNESKIYLIFMW